jgi:hypothetical protein
MVFHEPASLPYGGIYRGLQGIGPSSWAGLQGRSKRTGEQVDEPYVELLRFRDGKAIEGRIQMDTARILQALGAEAPAAANPGAPR